MKIVLSCLVAIPACLSCGSQADGDTVARSLTQAQTQDGRYISWKEYLIDDETLGGTVPIRGGDGLGMADLDHDDVLDMISIHGERSYVRVVFGSDDADTWFRLSLAEGREVRRPLDLAVGDADGDGFDDAVIACGEGHLLYLENPGGIVRGFRWGRVIPPATTRRGSFDRVSLADFDADGRLEVLAVNGGEGRDPNEDAPGPGISWFALPPDPLDGEAWRENVLLDQDFHFGPGTVTGYTPAAPNTTSFRAEPCTSPPPVGARARPSAHRR